MATPRALVSASAPALAGLALAGIWVALATWQPTTTWHLAPLLVVWAPPWVAVHRAQSRCGWVVTGAVLALFTTGMLHAADLLRGPTLVGPDATIEALIATVAGGLVALVMLRSCDGSGSST